MITQPEEGSEYKLFTATEIHLVTGFFGSGKTTFLNHVVAQLQGAHNILGLDDSLFPGENIVSGIARPEILLVEIFGAGYPVVERERIATSQEGRQLIFGDQFCIVDAANFRESLSQYPVVGRQVFSSDIFILNKTDLASREQVEEIKAIIGEYCAKPRFFEAIYAEVDAGALFTARGQTVKKRPNGKSTAGCMAGRHKKDQLWTAAARPHHDQLVSVSYRWLGGSIVYIEEMSLVLPHEVIRVKGFLTVEGVDFLYSYVMGHFIIVEQHNPVRDDLKNRITCILPAGALYDLEAVMSRYNFQSSRQKNSSIR